MTRARWMALAVVSAALAAVTATGALAFVRTRATSQKPLYWGSGCVFVSADVKGTTDIAGDTEQPIIPKVLANWQDKISPCGYLQLKFEGTVEDPVVGLDGDNVILFRQDRWCRPATEDAVEKCYAPQAAGITTVFYIDKATDEDDGELLDADIEFNAVNFRFAVDGQTADPVEGPIIADLENTLTHEVGHLIGLDHTCNDDPQNPIFDHLGQPAPSCNVASTTQEQRDATMFAFQDDGESKKSSIEADDLAGACDAYPKAKDPKQCKRVDLDGDGCQCRVGARRSRAGQGARGLLLALLVAGVWVARRRKG